MIITMYFCVKMQNETEIGTKTQWSCIKKAGGVSFRLEDPKCWYNSDWNVTNNRQSALLYWIYKNKPVKKYEYACINKRFQVSINRGTLLYFPFTYATVQDNPPHKQTRYINQEEAIMFHQRSSVNSTYTVIDSDSPVQLTEHSSLVDTLWK